MTFSNYCKQGFTLNSHLLCMKIIKILLMLSLHSFSICCSTVDSFSMFLFDVWLDSFLTAALAYYFIILYANVRLVGYKLIHVYMTYHLVYIGLITVNMVNRHQTVCLLSFSLCLFSFSMPVRIIIKVQIINN